MPQHGIEIRHSSNGAYLTFHGGGSRVTFNLRDVARTLSQAAEPGLQKRILIAWLKDRDAELQNQRRKLRDGQAAPAMDSDRRPVRRKRSRPFL
jgi:hypothetical protein